AILIGMCLGTLVAAAVGLVDAILNSVGIQRLLRTLVCAGVGLVGGILGSLIGQAMYNLGLPLFFGWIIVGVFIGGSIGVFDVLRASSRREDMKVPLKRVLNGVYGGLLGGFRGGLLFEIAYTQLGDPGDPMSRTR